MDAKEHSIRFINSGYDTLFRIPDGGTVEIRFPDRTFTAKCEYLDDYHTKIGDTVFHICEFAELLEHQVGTVHPEPEITADEAAWQLLRQVRHLHPGNIQGVIHDVGIVLRQGPGCFVIRAAEGHAGAFAAAKQPKKIERVERRAADMDIPLGEDDDAMSLLDKAAPHWSDPAPLPSAPP